MVASAVHAAAELLPVSSSGHLRALGGDGDDVAAHLVPLGVTLVAWRADVRTALRRLDRRRVGMHLAAGAIPSVAGVLAGARRDALPLPAGLLAGAAVLLVADRRGGGGRSRWDAGVADGVWLGLAQAAALWPGVSRLGTTLAVARLRGFAPAEAPVLAREVGVPVTAGALLWHARRSPSTGWQRSTRSVRVDLCHPVRFVCRRRRRPAAAGAGWAGTGAAVAGALAALPLARAVDRGAVLWPFAAERAVLALVVLRQSRRDE